ncbi:shikimate dehydrogenase [Romboutsia lituseburensis]|uniref:shikimate dehydrogenase n=1 Tax=Romboutsia lituseburensis TaxID=1537 RepID=UPI00215B019A|nr:shikimate dehydrogenase [Romboutsia lituseburensis]MCR8745206.1 shikimate dehydrogenase [Romboutsia lituseburensis]
MNINSMTKIIGLLGHPVKHSFSPQIHNYLCEKYNQNNIYCCFDVEKQKLKSAVEGIKTFGMIGCNVTIPHKVDIIKYIDQIDKNADIIGAVNTIKNIDGKLIGFNTDGVGFVKSILEKGYALKNKRVLIIGAGGACRSICVELASQGVSYLEIRNRSLDKANQISKTIKNNFSLDVICDTKSIDENDLNNIDILINTTPIGMESKLCPIDENLTPKGNILVCDIVYKPHNTALLNWAKKNNLNVVHGIDMLINQGLHAFYIWTGIKATKEDEEYIKDLYNKM